MEFVLVVLLLAGAAALITSPLRRKPPALEVGAELSALETAKAAKLDEIRDAELDFQVGKLSAGEYRALDVQLRAEAIDLLHQIDAARVTDEGAAGR